MCAYSNMLKQRIPEGAPILEELQAEMRKEIRAFEQKMNMELFTDAPSQTEPQT
jgi:hypothetical protein